MSHTNRILHVDGDSFFASCEVALDRRLQGRPVWVGGGRRGDGIVIAANKLAKKFGITTGMACFEARRKCPQGDFGTSRPDAAGNGRGASSSCAGQDGACRCL